MKKTETENNIVENSDDLKTENVNETDLKSSESDDNIASKTNGTQKSKFQNDSSKTLYNYENSKVDFFQSLSAIQYLSAHNFLAIDIDTDKVRYLTGKANGKNIQVRDWGVHVSPAGEKDRFKGIKLTLDNLKANHYKAGYKVHVCFFSPDITVRQFILPKLRKAHELRNAVYFKLQTDLPGFSETSQWRYQIIDEFEENGSRFLRIVVIVVPGDLIKNILELLDGASLTPDTLVPRSVASFHSFQRMIPDSECDILVDVSYDITHINFIANNNLEYSRNIASGAANLEVAVHDKKGKILGPDSMAIKEEDGIGKNGALRPEMIRKALQSRLKILQSQQNPVLQLFKNELQNSIEYFSGLNKRYKVNRIFLTGYGIQKESLLSFLKNSISQPVFILSPKLEDVKNTLQYGQFFTTLGTIIGSRDTFNLIPKEFQNKLMFRRLNYLVSFIILIIVLGLTYLNISLDHSSETLNAQLSAVTKQYQELNPIEAEYQRISKEIENLRNEQSQLLNAVKDGTPVINVMKFLSNETPDQIVLSDFSFNSGEVVMSNRRGTRRKSNNDAKNTDFQVRFSGNVVGDYLMSDITLINYVDHLKNLKFFKTIKISQKDKKSDRQSLRFEISATL